MNLSFHSLNTARKKTYFYGNLYYLAPEEVRPLNFIVILSLSQKKNHSNGKNINHPCDSFRYNDWKGKIFCMLNFNKWDDYSKN